jgi:hypothetical protein
LALDPHSQETLNLPDPDLFLLLILRPMLNAWSALSKVQHQGLMSVIKDFGQANR